MRYEAQYDYDLWHTKQYKMKLNLKTDKDIIDWLDGIRYGRSKDTVQGTLKRLIRQAILMEKELEGSVSFE